MATKKIKTIIKIVITAGKLEPAKIGQALGPQGLNLQQFMAQVNEATKDQNGEQIPVEITVFEDRTFLLKYKTSPAAFLLRQAAGIEKGSGVPNKTKAGKVTKAQVRGIAEKKMADLNANDIAAAMKIVEGTARSMGIEVK
jgi:large subunit ribosomal protein L11